jgi:hypothetical protein
MPLAIPIPAFIILDAFDKDIDSVIIFEHIMSLPSDNELPDATKTFILNFLKATVVKSAVTENNVKLQESLFYSQPTTLANKWKSICLKQMLPTLINPPAANPCTTSAAASQPLTLNAELIATIICAARGDARNEQVGEEEKKDNEDNAATDSSDRTLGLSESTFAKLLTMCGVAQGFPDEVPTLWSTLAEKGAMKADKELEVCKTLAKAIWWKEAKVKPLTTLISMIAKRQFKGNLTVSTLASATKGLNPFAVLCMTQLEVDNINGYEQALAQATATTMSDVKANKIKASAPGTHAGLLKVICRFGSTQTNVDT